MCAFSGPHVSIYGIFLNHEKLMFNEQTSSKAKLSETECLHLLHLDSRVLMLMVQLPAAL
jgi:hypothetical protein